MGPFGVPPGCRQVQLHFLSLDIVSYITNFIVHASLIKCSMTLCGTIIIASCLEINKRLLIYQNLQLDVWGFCSSCHRVSVVCNSFMKLSTLWNLWMQFIGATMGSAGLNIRTENGNMGMPTNFCCVVVEYLPGGALKSFLIKNRRRKLAFKVVIQLSLDLARG